MVKIKIFIFSLTNLLIFFCMTTPVWSTKRGAEEQILQIEKNKKLKSEISILDIVERMKKNIYVSDNFLQHLCLEDLQSYNETFNSVDDNFDSWVWIVLKSNRENYFPFLLEQARQRALIDDSNFTAQFNLGWMYGNGKGIIKDDRKAFEYYLNSAEKGYAPAQNNVGRMYQQGTGVAQDDEKAFEWILKSAEQGYAPAQHDVGHMYQEGKGVDYDDSKASEWLLKSAEQGYFPASYEIGYRYQEGKSIIQSDKEALKWYTSSAMQGYALAQSALGCLYLEGKRVPRSYSNSIYWLLKSAVNEDKITKEISVKFLKFIFSLSAPQQFNASEEKKMLMKESYETLKENIQILLGLHDLEAGFNKENSSFIESKIALPAVGELYKKVVDFEQTCLSLMQSFKKPGFMINCIKSSDDEIFKELASGSFVKCYTYDSLSFLTFGEENIQAADILMSILNRCRTPEQRVGVELYRLKNALLEDYLKESIKTQDKVHHNLVQEDKAQLLEKKILKYDSLISKVKTEIDSFEELALIPTQLAHILIKDVPMRNQKFLNKYPFFEE